MEQTFGKMIANKRKALRISQKELASRIFKENGEPISAQYLNDIEHDRRHPPDEIMINQLSRHLHIEADVLFFLAGEIPPRIRELSNNPDRIAGAMRVFRRELNKQ